MSHATRKTEPNKERSQTQAADEHKCRQSAAESFPATVIPGSLSKPGERLLAASPLTLAIDADTVAAWAMFDAIALALTFASMAAVAGSVAALVAAHRRTQSQGGS